MIITDVFCVNGQGLPESAFILAAAALLSVGAYFISLGIYKSGEIGSYGALITIPGCLFVMIAGWLVLFTVPNPHPLVIEKQCSALYQTNHAYPVATHKV